MRQKTNKQKWKIGINFNKERKNEVEMKNVCLKTGNKKQQSIILRDSTQTPKLENNMYWDLYVKRK